MPRLPLAPAVKARVKSSAALFWQQFYQTWHDCKSCPLHECRDKMVFFRGVIPANILFIGEAPGESENQFGYPFIGPAGQYLDDLLAEAGVNADEICITNVVCCRPADPNGIIREPTAAEFKACSKRLHQFVQGVKPRLIVYLGRIAAASTKSLTGWSIALKHPSWIMQQPGGFTGKEGLERKRFILALRQAINDDAQDASHITEYVPS